METRTDKADFALDFVDIEIASGVPDAQYERFQIQYLNNSTRYGIDIKARQIAWSFTAALDAVVDAVLDPGRPYIFVSINQDEAREKIRYCAAIVEAMRPDVRPGILRHSQQEMELSNGSRFISHPCRPPRGKASARIYLDEMAHYAEGMDREIYRAALPATIKGGGYLRIGSSPMGARGLFWEIFSQSLRTYPGYDKNRQMIPWWHVRALCRDVPQADRLAPAMITEERVLAFGTPALVEIFENMFLEDFQQEYECAWVDESVAWIPWELIQRNQKADLLHYHIKSVDDVEYLVQNVRRDIAEGKIEPALTGGIDVGRKRNLTEMVGLGLTTTGQYPLRMMVSLDRVEYDSQEDCFRRIITALPFTQVLVDRNGIGAQLAENLERTGRAQGVDFTNPSKELWAVEARIQAGRGNVPIPLERDLAYQIHSIKKKVTAAKNVVYDTERNEKHHADKFWAWALAIWAAAGGERYGPPGVVKYA